MSSKNIWLEARKDLKSVSKEELKDACEELGLSKTGNKPDLFDRLEKHFSSSSSSSSVDVPKGGEPVSRYELCAGIFKSGKNKGESCTHPAKFGTFCGIHQGQDENDLVV